MGGSLLSKAEVPGLSLLGRGGNRAGWAGLGRVNSGSGQNWPDFFEPKF